MERWRYTLERRAMKVRRNTTEYVCLNESFSEAAKVRKVDELPGRRKKEKHHR